MKNPWENIGSNNILELDRLFIESQPILSEDRYRVQDQLNPFPFFGNPDKSKIIILLSNPGYSPINNIEHRDKKFSEQYRLSLLHKSIHPYVDKNFSWTSGFKWWRNNIFKDLAMDVPNLYDGNVIEKIMCIQMFPYHSTEFKKTSAPNLPSFEYAHHLLKSSMENGKFVIALRAPWRDYILKSTLPRNNNFIICKLHGKQKPVLDKNGKWIERSTYEAVRDLLLQG